MSQTADFSEEYKNAMKRFNDQPKHRVIKYKHLFKGKKYTCITHIMEWDCAEFVKHITSCEGVCDVTIALAEDDDNDR